jgi:hypothetical protein
MFNVALRPGMALTRVLTMTRALGQSASEAGEQPEIFVWTDPGKVQVRCVFQYGKLASLTLERPPEEEALAAP